MSFADLRDARPGELALAADAWGQLSKDLAKLEDRVTGELTGPLRRSGWAGPAAAAAFRIVDLLDDECELAALQVRNVAAVLRKAADEFDGVHCRLLAAVGAATQELGLRVDDHGRVHAPRPSGAELHDPDGQDRYRLKQQNAMIYEDVIRKILSDASVLDYQYAQALRTFAPLWAGEMTPSEWSDASRDAQGVLHLMGLSGNDMPKPGGDPNTAAAWWRGLSDDQRSLYATAYPAQVGSLGGLPVADRHQANTHTVRNLIGEHMSKMNPDLSDRHHVRLNNLLNRLEASEYGPPAPQLYLLGIDNIGDGQAVVAVGNPDTARHTAVLVPGVNTTLDGMEAQIDRAARMQQLGDGLTVGVDGDVSVIAWLGYDPPSGNETAGAPFGKQSAAGADALDQFINGIRTSHQPGDTHVTAVGHSYGTTVIGHASTHGDGLAVHDVITLGSPGMRTEHAADLNVGASHVWAGAAADDPIANPQGHAGLTATIASILTNPFTGPFTPLIEDNIHNISPHYPEFGANQFHVDTSGHSGYWDRDSESLRNQARIIVGYYDRVSLDHGTVPS